MPINPQDTPNPVGVSQIDDYLKAFIETMKSRWDAEKKTSRWWKFWQKVSLSRVTIFLLNCLSEIIHYVDEKLESGPDKKATVLDVISTLYDYTIREAMPIFLKPFSSKIKDVIVNFVISAVIDWLVDQYKNGDWRKSLPAHQ